jgi:hypothetical protein
VRWIEQLQDLIESEVDDHDRNDTAPVEEGGSCISDHLHFAKD